MGVPGLEPFVCSKSKECVTEIIQGENLNREVDYLYTDSNGILHSICQRIFNYGEKKSLLDFYEGVAYDKKISAVYEEYFIQILNITKIIKPRRVLYLAIDGPAPLAKQNQQRQRRFGRSYTSSSTSVNDFDTNSITPGTQFMHELTLFMKEAIVCAMDPNYVNCKLPKSILNFSGIWKNIEVIFSPPTVPGEGEHKLMEYIRNLPNEEFNNASHCFFGPDGDLIMLGMSSTLPKVHLLRQDIFRQGCYKFIDINKFSRDLGKLFEGDLHYQSLQHVKDDFVMLGMFVGNDFLPRMQMFVTVREGLDYLISAMKVIGNITLTYSNEKDSHVSISGLCDLVSYLAKFEKDVLKDQVLTEDRRLLPPENDVRFLNTLILKNIQVENENITFDFEKYRNEYNLSHFQNEDIEHVCYDYVKTLVWVFEYYRNGIVDWDWAYRFHYPPLMNDLASFFQNRNLKDLTFDFHLGSPTFPFEQLLGVLPPSSSSLLPEPYSTLLESTMIVPEELRNPPKIDREGKIREHEAVILLPFSDYQLVRKIYHETKSTSRKFNRDTPSFPIKYSRNDGKVKLRLYKN